MAQELIWPFATKDPSQYRRIDQGWDLQVAVGTPVLAVADGVIFYAHDAAGFGDPYPVLKLNFPVLGNPSVYYGHQHPEVFSGQAVHQGDIIAHAAQTPGGNASALPGWLELGWWGWVGPTGNGQSMRDYLINRPVFGGDMPLSADDLSKITEIVQEQITNATTPPNGTIFKLWAAFWNNQESPLLQRIITKIGA